MAKRINIMGDILFDEPMASHTTFRTGGRADVFIRPRSPEDLALALRSLNSEGIPCFILGGGANILVADEGIRGAVLTMERLKDLSWKDHGVRIQAGMEMSRAAWVTGTAGFQGLESFYAMPGSLGGAMWMNARCYGRAISDTLVEARLLSLGGEFRSKTFTPADFAYKVSPFQRRREIILEGTFRLTPADSRGMERSMREIEEDRRCKGHFDAPSAGSAFKNNRTFGKPSGLIIDEAGLKGFSLGDARVSPRHGNIVQNGGQASSRDIRNLLETIQREVKRQFGFSLEREVLFVGEWPEGGDFGSEGST